MTVDFSLDPTSVCMTAHLADCPACGAQTTPMGRLAMTVHYRCAACGITFSEPVACGVDCSELYEEE